MEHADCLMCVKIWILPGASVVPQRH